MHFVEDRLRFTFADSWLVYRYEKWAFHAVFNAQGGKGALDFVARDPRRRAWLLEVTDYRRPITRMKQGLPKPSRLAQETAKKVLDTWEGVEAAAESAAVRDERLAARKLRAVDRRRVVLHLEQTRKPTKLFPRYFDPANIAQMLKQALNEIDHNPLVVEMASADRVPWGVSKARKRR